MLDAMKKSTAKPLPRNPVPGITTDISEEELEQIEADPAFQRMMRNAERDIRDGKTIPMEEVIREARARTKRRSRSVHLPGFR